LFKTGWPSPPPSHGLLGYLTAIMPPLPTHCPAALFSSFVPLLLFFAAVAWLNLLPIKVNKI